MRRSVRHGVAVAPQVLLVVVGQVAAVLHGLQVQFLKSACVPFATEKVNEKLVVVT